MKLKLLYQIAKNSGNYSNFINILANELGYNSTDETQVKRLIEGDVEIKVDKTIKSIES